MGGRVGLKGTDAPGAAARAAALGARPEAALRMTLCLSAMATRLAGVRMLAAPGAMGMDAARAAGLDARPIGAPHGASTTAADTRAAAAALRDAGCTLLLFAGGDGTARDLCAVLGEGLPVLGVPAGVKMHSAAFAASPRAAADLALMALQGRASARALEIMDLDEEAYAAGTVAARLHGYVRGPFAAALAQGPKVRGAAGEAAALAGIAAAVAAEMGSGRTLVLGPGTTLRAVAAALGVPKTLLGVDVVRDGRVLAADASERDILATLGEGGPADILVTPIGGQGHILGRGNQPLSPAVLRRAGLDSLVVVATTAKLATLHDQTLRVDSGDPALDAALAGWRRVLTGPGTAAVCRVA